MLKLTLLFMLGAGTIRAQETITAGQAKDFVGKEAVVCGTVASASFIAKGKGAPTLLNLDEPYPKQIFTVVIYGKDRQKFGKPESGYLKKEICVSGTIETFKGKPQIVAKDPKQIKLKAKKAQPAAR